MTHNIKGKKDKSITKLILEDGGGLDGGSDKNMEETVRKDKTYKGGEDIVRPLTYDAPDDDELLKIAEATYKNAKNESIQSATDEAERKKKSLNESIIGKNQELKEKTNSISDTYDSVANKLENQTLKRGIQRSSAVIGGLSELESQKLSAIEKLQRQTTSDIEKLNQEIYDLESELGKEISSINEKYANAVEVRLHELKNERDEKMNEVIKYNNTLDLFYDQDYYDSDKEVDYTDLDLSTVKQRYRERIEEVLGDYLNLEDPKEAYELYTTNDSVKDYLGKYYNYVLNILKNNAESNN